MFMCVKVGRLTMKYLLRSETLWEPVSIELIILLSQHLENWDYGYLLPGQYNVLDF